MSISCYYFLTQCKYIVIIFPLMKTMKMKQYRNQHPTFLRMFLYFRLPKCRSWSIMLDGITAILYFVCAYLCCVKDTVLIAGIITKDSTMLSPKLGPDNWEFCANTIGSLQHWADCKCSPHYHLNNKTIFSHFWHHSLAENSFLGLTI